MFIPAERAGAAQLPNAPVIFVASKSVNFGSVKVGGVSAPSQVSVGNTGNAELAVSGVTISGKHALEFSLANPAGFVVAAGASSAVGVEFRPTSSGAKNAVLTITSDDPKRRAVKVRLSGQAPPPKISVNPAPIEFGAVNLGAVSAPRTITITNSGVSDLQISAIALAGAHAAEFGQTNNCATVTSGNSCAIDVIFNPSSVGRKKATLTFSSSDTRKKKTTVKLSGNGTAPPIPADPLNLNVEKDDEAKASAFIEAETGGVVTATGKDGTVYMLSIPPYALIGDETVTLTPVSKIVGLPTSGGVLAAVDFEPRGMQLLVPATLTIMFPSPVDPSKIIALAYAGSKNEAYLQAETGGGYGITVTVTVDHFSGRVVITGDKCDRDALGNRTPADPANGIKHKIAKQIKSQGNNDPDALEPLYREWYETIIKPGLTAAETDDTNFACAVAGYIIWQKEVFLQGLEGKFAKEVAASEASLKKAYPNAFEKAFERCVTDKDPYQAGIMLQLGREAQLMGFAGYRLTDDYVFSKVEKCSRYEVTIDSIVDSYEPAEPLQTHGHFAATNTARLNINDQIIKSAGGVSADHTTVATGPDGSDSVSHSATFTVNRLNVVGGRSLVCSDEKPKDPPLTVTLFYSAETISPWKGFYDQFLHLADKVPPQFVTVLGEYVATDFVKGGDVFAKKTYSKTDHVETTTISEDTLITITHKPQK